MCRGSWTKPSSATSARWKKTSDLVEALLLVGDPPEFHQGLRIRLVDIRVVCATSSPFQ